MKKPRSKQIKCLHKFTWRMKYISVKCGSHLCNCWVEVFYLLIHFCIYPTNYWNLRMHISHFCHGRPICVPFAYVSPCYHDLSGRQWKPLSLIKRKIILTCTWKIKRKGKKAARSTLYGFIDQYLPCMVSCCYNIQVGL